MMLVVVVVLRLLPFIEEKGGGGRCGRSDGTSVVIVLRDWYVDMLS